MPIRGKSTRLIFSNDRLEDLLREIADYIKNGNSHIETLAQDLVIIFDNEESEYIATLYLEIQRGE